MFFLCLLFRWKEKRMEMEFHTRHNLVAFVSTDLGFCSSACRVLRMYHVCVFLGLKQERIGKEQKKKKPSRMVKIKVVFELQRVRALKLHRTYLLCSFSSHEYWGACWLVVSVCVGVCVCDSSAVGFWCILLLRPDIRSRSRLQRAVVCLLCASNMWKKDKNTEARGEQGTKESAGRWGHKRRIQTCQDITRLQNFYGWKGPSVGGIQWQADSVGIKVDRTETRELPTQTALISKHRVRPQSVYVDTDYK